MTGTDSWKRKNCGLWKRKNDTPAKTAKWCSSHLRHILELLANSEHISAFHRPIWCKTGALGPSQTIEKGFLKSGEQQERQASMLRSYFCYGKVCQG